MKYIFTALLLALTGSLGLSMAETTTGVTVQGAVKFTNGSQTVETGAEGMVYLLSADGSVAHSGEVSVQPKGQGGKYISYYSIDNVVAGTYTLLFEGRATVSNSLKALSYTEQNVVVAGTNLTKDITAAIEENRGWMEFKIKYDADFYPAGTPGYQSTPIADAEVTCTKVGETAVKKTKTTYTGIASFLVPNASSAEYNITVKAGAIYLDTTFKVGYSATLRDVYMRQRPVVNVKLSGTVTLNGTAMRNATSLGLKMGLIDFKGEIHTAPINAAGGYNFDGDNKVPAGEAVLYLHDADNGDAQNRSYLYGIKTPVDGKFTIGTEAENTQNVEVEKVASAVSGTVKGLLLGFGDQAKIKLTKEGATTAAYETDVQVEGLDGRYKFPAVAPGKYAVAFVCPGYAVEGTIANVEVSLSADATIAEITVKTVPFTVTFTGAAQAYNSKNELVSFSSAKIELWSYDNTASTVGEKLKDGITTDQNGGFSFTHEMKLQDGYCIKITHDSIKPNQATGQVKKQEMAVQFPAFEFATAEDKVKLHTVKDFAAMWNATGDTLLLSWSWPDSLKDVVTYRITGVSLERRMEGTTSSIRLGQWENSSGFSFTKLPRSYKDTVKSDDNYCDYIFTINYEKPQAEALKVTYRTNITKKPSYLLTCGANNPSAGYVVRGGGTESYTGGRFYEDVVVDLMAIAKSGYAFKAWVDQNNDTIGRMVGLSVKMGAHDTTLTAVFFRDETVEIEYTLTLIANDPAFGEVSGDGTYKENTSVTAMAIAKDGYIFKEWQENGAVVANAGAYYTFTLTADRVLTAIFVQGEGVEERETAVWSLFAERDGVLVIKGMDGDGYMVYDLNGRMVAQVRNARGEERVRLETNRLYMVRRVALDGQWDVKKIVLR